MTNNIHASDPLRWKSPPNWGVKGSRVQISLARPDDGGLSRLIRAAFIRRPGHPRQPQCRGVRPDWADQREYVTPTSRTSSPSRTASSSTSTRAATVFLTVESRTPPPTGQAPNRSARLAPLLLELPVCSKYIDCSLWKFQGAPRFLGLGVPTATHGTLKRNPGRHGWLTVGVAFKINQASRQGIAELRPPVSGRLAGKVRVDQADGGGTFAHRCCHPFD